MEAGGDPAELKSKLKSFELEERATEDRPGFNLRGLIQGLGLKFSLCSRRAALVSRIIPKSGTESSFSAPKLSGSLERFFEGETKAGFSVEDGGGISLKVELELMVKDGIGGRKRC